MESFNSSPIAAADPWAGFAGKGWSVGSAISNCEHLGVALLASEGQLLAKLAKLSRMQMVVLGYLTGGCLNKQIAAACGIHESTVKAHVHEILRRLEVRSRTEAAVTLAILIDRHRQQRHASAESARVDSKAIRPEVAETQGKLSIVAGRRMCSDALSSSA